MVVEEGNALDGSTLRGSRKAVAVLYIDDAARSGSRALSRVLGSQPGCMTVGEAVFIWRFGVMGNDRCSCRMRFSNCPFWQEVADTSPGAFDKKTAQRYEDFVNLVALKPRHTPWLLTSFGRSKLVN